ncbi:MAG: transporter substrate-binding domain-containing protein [Pseudomonadota bacterium]
MDVDFPPFGKVDGTGHLQYLVQQAAKNMRVDLERHVAPRRRCLEEIKTGVSDAMASAYSPQRAETAAFPMVGGVIDASKALGVMTYHVYRRTGSALDWDGARFKQLGAGRLGVQAGFVYITDRFTQIGVPYDDGAKALEPTLAKLAAGRVEGVVGMMEEADSLIAKHYPGQMERTGTVFEQTPIYLMVSRQFYSQNQKLVERYWQALRSYRNSDDYRRYQISHP